MMTFCLTLLGHLDLCGPDGEPILDVLRQPKRLAVLVYLAMAGKGFVRRDTLLGLLWAELPLDRGRRALNQAIHYLRRALGHDVIVSRGTEEVGLAPDRIWCDAAEFERLMATAQFAEALALYRGDLLDGLFVEGAGPFEAWLDRERSRLRDVALESARGLSSSADATGDSAGAVMWARRAAEISPWDERSLRGLLELLARHGQVEAAAQAYGDFADRLRIEFEDEPSAETRRLIEVIREAARSAPARVVVETTAATEVLVGAAPREPSTTPVRPGDPDSPEPDPAPEVLHPVHEEPAVRPRRGWRTRIPVGLTLLAVGALALAADHGATHRPARFPDRPRIAVSAFEDLSADASLGYLASALSRAINAQLAEVQGLDVVGAAKPELSGAPRRQGSGASGSPADIIVNGSVLRSADRVRVQVIIVDGSTGATTSTSTIERPLGEPFSLVDGVAQQVAGGLRTELGREVRLRKWRAGTRSQEAWLAFEQAEAAREEAERLQESGAWSAAVAEVRAADSLAAFAERKALKWSAAPYLRARIKWLAGWLYARPPHADDRFRFSAWDSALAALDRAVELQPEYAEALEFRAAVRDMRAHRFHGPVRQALRRAAAGDAAAAVALDPARSKAWTLLASTRRRQGDFAGAYVAARRARETDIYRENAPENLLNLVLDALEVHDDSAALAACRELRVHMAGAWVGTYCGLELVGTLGLLDDPEFGLPRLLSELEVVSQKGPVPAALSLTAVRALARAGLRDSALAVLRRSRRSGMTEADLGMLEAAAFLAVQLPDSAADRLGRYIAEDPQDRAWAARSRIFHAPGPAPRTRLREQSITGR